MENNFIEGMEILIDCKRLVEDLLRETEIKINMMYERGRDTKWLEEQRTRYLKTLRRL